MTSLTIGTPLTGINGFGNENPASTKVHSTLIESIVILSKYLILGLDPDPKRLTSVSSTLDFTVNLSILAGSVPLGVMGVLDNMNASV